MNLKHRLILANTATVIVPILITVLLAMTYLFFSGSLTNPDLTLDTYQKRSEIQVELLNIEQLIRRQTPETLSSPEIQAQLRDHLAAFQGEVVILKEDTVLFASRPISKIDLAKSLEMGKSGGHSTVNIGSSPYHVRTAALSFSGSSGTMLLLAPADTAPTPDLRRLLIFCAVTLFLAFILSNVVMTYHLAHKILTPLSHLRQAATEISSGLLDFPIVEEGDQELQELCRDLEIMRLRLKDSVHTQLRFEDNRKMLISSISHDLKTPVTSIKGYVEGILDGIANTPEKHERYLKTIYTKAQLLDQMIDDLLLYAKLDLQQLPFDFEPTDLGAFIENFVRENEPECLKSGIRLLFHDETVGSYAVPLDRTRFHRVLMNILDNSKKYQKADQPVPDSWIQVTLRETQSSLILELHDNGIGIPENDLPYVFDRFYRSDTSRSGVKGSGLGLAIAKQIVEEHGGRIWALSPAQEGTRILISLSKY